MKIHIARDKNSLGLKAATSAAAFLREILLKRGEANVIFATGASQFEMFRELVSLDLEWKRVNCFHLDEYVGLPETHPASFRRYLKERFCAHVDGPKTFHWVNGDCPDPSAECERLGEIIRQHPIDVACVGIGENGHLAFNDPPADFETEDPYLVVELDEACRRQQMGEGWFPSLEVVPTKAISMSIRQIVKSAAIICTVPDQRKARAVQAAVEGPVTPEVPASILQKHAHTTLVLDTASASLLSKS
jgi:glucosamine-6-phosphate deaminase